MTLDQLLILAILLAAGCIPMLLRGLAAVSKDGTA